MVEISEIEYSASLEAWLQDQPREFSTVIAARSAMRVLPLFWQWSLNSSARKPELTALPILRSNLISAVACKSPTAATNGAFAYSARASFDYIKRAFIEGTPTHGAAPAAAAPAATLANNAEASTDSVSFAVHDAAEAVAAFSDAAEATFWESIRRDCADLEAGRNLLQTPLWRDEYPLADLWTDLRPKILSAENWQPGDWRFWVNWYEQMLDPVANPPNWELLEQVALIKPEVWDAGPEAVSDAVVELQKEHYRIRETSTRLSETSLFDFVEFNRRLKAVGFPSDLSPFESAEKREAFSNDVSDFRAGLMDWVDYCRDEIAGHNQRLPLLQAAEKLVAQLDAIERGDQVSLRRFVMVASDLRRFSMATKYRDMVGDTLAEMLDDRIDEYREISGKHFGPIFEVLEPLQKLDLGSHNPGDLIAAIKEALVRMEGVNAADMPPLDPETRVLFEELLRELEEWDAELNEATTEAGREIVRQRFSERFAAFSVTYARMVERGVEVSKSTSKIFDEAVKWYKRWDTIEKIIDWWDKLGGPPPGAG